MYRKILIPVENSAADQTILDHIKPLARLFGKLLGMELKLRQYRLGKSFCDAVVEADLGSEDAAFRMEQAEGHELGWYATQEIGPLLELG